MKTETFINFLLSNEEGEIFRYNSDRYHTSAGRFLVDGDIHTLNKWPAQSLDFNMRIEETGAPAKTRQSP